MLNINEQSETKNDVTVNAVKVKSLNIYIL